MGKNAGAEVIAQTGRRRFLSAREKYLSLEYGGETWHS